MALVFGRESERAEPLSARSFGAVRRYLCGSTHGSQSANSLCLSSAGMYASDE